MGTSFTGSVNTVNFGDWGRPSRADYLFSGQGARINGTQRAVGRFFEFSAPVFAKNQR